MLFFIQPITCRSEKQRQKPATRTTSKFSRARSSPHSRETDFKQAKHPRNILQIKNFKRTNKLILKCENWNRLHPPGGTAAFWSGLFFKRHCFASLLHIKFPHPILQQGTEASTRRVLAQCSTALTPAFLVLSDTHFHLCANHTVIHSWVCPAQFNFLPTEASKGSSSSCCIPASVRKKTGEENDVVALKFKKWY